MPAGSDPGRVLRSRTLDRSLGRLALVAMLLVAFAPSVSRVLASGTPQVLAGWSELCTSMGLKALPSGAHAAADASTPTPTPPAAGDHCDYCPLAASLSLVLLALLFAPPPLHRQARFAYIAPRLRAVANLRGLGSRGPPLPL